MKKIELAAQFLNQNTETFRCPICHSHFTMDLNSLVCEQGHRFDLSKKGTLFFVNHKVDSEYDLTMLSKRQALLRSDFFTPFLEHIAAKMKPKKTILDAGCGEGTPTKILAEKIPGNYIGIDLSKPGIQLATSAQRNDLFFCVADLANLPIETESIDYLLNIFSPSHYQEFHRVLKSDGKLFKVIPNADYLIELRQALYRDQRKENYDNSKVLNRFEEKFPNFETERIRYQFELTEENRDNLIEMTPLTWQASAEQKARLKQSSLNRITVDVTLLIGEK